MRGLRIGLAVAALVAIGTAEALESVRQLNELPGRGRPPVSLGGSVLTLASIALSIIVFAVLGWTVSGPARDAVRDGATVGIFAGLLGGSARGLLVRDYLDNVVSRLGFGADVVSWSLAILVLLSIIVSAAAGAMVSWLGFRSSRRPRPRPPP